MVSAQPSDTPPRSLRVRQFYLARQPILDRDQALAGYELLFRNADEGAANIVTDLSATASVIAHTTQLGLHRVVGDTIGFVNVDAAVLMSDIFEFLPREKVVLEIVETMKVTPDILERVKQLAAQGFRFALDDVITDSDDVKQLLPLVDIIKFDLRDMPLSALLNLTPRFRIAGKKLLAEKVESIEQFQVCLALGFDYFQGYYFAQPVVLTGRKLSPSQMAVMQLMNMITSDADNRVIEDAIKRDVTLGLNMLRLVNSPAIGMRHRIDSLSQALLVLGREQLRRWLQIMLYAEPCKKGHNMTPLLTLASTRGKLLELIAEKLQPTNRRAADTAFTVGIMSLMDALFGIPMEKILEEIAVVEPVAEALLRKNGFFGDILQLTEYIERIEESDALIAPLLDKLGLSSEDLYRMEVEAFDWSNNIAAAAAQQYN